MGPLVTSNQELPVPMKTFKKLATLLMALLICSCSSPTRSEGPAIGGYCVVCYHSAGKAVKGTAEFTSEHEGQTYHFVNQEALDTFEAEPEKYLPQYDGWCAYGVTFGQKVEIDPTVFSIVDGKLYLNKNESIGKKFDKNTDKYIAKADAKWPKIK